jgi:hypothetical protein
MRSSWENVKRVQRFSVGVIGAVALALSGTAAADGKAQQLPLSDFLDAQGTTGVFQPPNPDTLGWSGRPPDYPNLGFIDYTGLVNDTIVGLGGTSLGTEVRGTFKKRDLAGGKVEYSVDIHTTNAFASMQPIGPNPDFANDPYLFGNRSQDVAAGATPAIGNCHFFMVWRADAGEAILDAAQLILGEVLPAGLELIELSFRGTATGPIHENAGLGPEGTPGRLVISQTGIFHTAFKGATGDGFPAEVVDLHPLAH